MRKTIGIAAATAVLFTSAAVAVGAGPTDDFDRPDIVGTDAADTLTGSVGSERIFALAGNDTVNGNPGSDWLDGGRGEDALDGSSGNDLLTGETCNAEVCDPPETDVLRGGSGADRIESNRCRTDVTPQECPDGRANDRLYGADGDDDLILNAPGRTLADGGPGNDDIDGSAGNDQLVGGTGRDDIDGDRGNDTINALDRNIDDVNCGPGRDSVRADKNDRLSNCEQVTPKRKTKKDKKGADKG
ncbi:MAG TPA: calcium-binding protein [Capillimicrobium sp.]|jgi:Ca2+-binding RTX toxin-like protein